jgi:hypothetical protein
MPSPSAGSKPFKALIIFCSYSANPCDRGLGDRYAHVIHKAFPTDWGQLFHRAEPIQRSVVGGYLSGDGARLSSMPPAAVCPRFLHRVMHRLGANSGMLSGLWETPKKHPQAGCGQKMIALLEGLLSQGWSEMPPCFPQAVPHYPWTRSSLWKQGLAGEYWRVSRERHGKLSTLRMGLPCSPRIQLSARQGRRYAPPR